MDEEKFKELIAQDAIDEDGDLDCLYPFVRYTKGSNIIIVDGTYTLEQLEAIVWYFKENQGT